MLLLMGVPVAKTMLDLVQIAALHKEV